MDKIEIAPKLSIIVICFNMRREAAQTLYTLSDYYQRNVSSTDYQVIVLDNNSSSPLEPKFVESFGPNFEYHYFATQSRSPAAAVNHGASLAKGQYISCIVDGARMLSPGIVHYTLLASQTIKYPFISALAWHLGPKEQNQSMLEGYDQIEEDSLLGSVDWRADGYRLFDISSQASSSNMGFLGGLPHECSYFAVEKSVFLELGGFDDRFQSPGGGLVNHDFLQRVVKRNELNFVMLLGEGSFHQFHGGIATNAKPEKHPWKLFAEEYENIHGLPFEGLTQSTDKDIYYLGCMPEAALKFITNLPV